MTRIFIITVFIFIIVIIITISIVIIIVIVPDVLKALVAVVVVVLQTGQSHVRNLAIKGFFFRNTVLYTKSAEWW